METKFRRFLNKTLFFIELDCELIVPDIDIIIYDAMSVDNRDGYVCIELGKDENKYAYQKISEKFLSKLCNRLQPQGNLININNNTNPKSEKDKLPISSIVFWSKVGLSGFFSVLLTVLKITKIYSWQSAIQSLIPSLISIFLAFIAIKVIDLMLNLYKKDREDYTYREKKYATTLSSDEMQNHINKVTDELYDEVLATLQLEKVEHRITMPNNCKRIWLLTDLSRGISSDKFIKWIEETLSSSLINFVFLLSNAIETKGRMNPINKLKNNNKDRIQITDIDIEKHYIWSDTYSVLFLETDDNSDLLFISLGDINGLLFKKIDSTEIDESDRAIVLGILKKLANLDV